MGARLQLLRMVNREAEKPVAKKSNKALRAMIQWEVEWLQGQAGLLGKEPNARHMLRVCWHIQKLLYAIVNKPSWRKFYNQAVKKGVA